MFAYDSINCTDRIKNFNKDVELLKVPSVNRSKSVKSQVRKWSVDNSDTLEHNSSSSHEPNRKSCVLIYQSYFRHFLIC